ncbi:MAG TPA: restriction endonuclease subunit S, partial [Aequorivita sp.]|nr:restriction endonuclease subunit S [Aequorivita sp.]
MTQKSKEGRNVPNLRFPGFEDEWERKKIAKVLQIGSGKDFKHLQKGDIPVFGTGGYMSSVNDFLFDGKSVLIGRKGTINKPFYFEGKFWTVDTLFYTHTFQNSLPIFIFNLFETINWLKYNEASGVPSLSKRTIEQIEIDLPTKQEQRKIASFLSLIDQRIQTQNQIIKNLESLMLGLRQKIFSQQIRFKDDEENEFPEWTKVRLDNLTSKTDKKNKQNIQYPIYSINNKEGFLPQGEQFEGMDSNERGYDISLYKVINKNT